MKHQNLKLSIPKPCHENWDKMSGADKGRFCDVCSKTVIDFTQMKTDEIITYISKSSETVCGRVNTQTLMISADRVKRNYFRQVFSFLFFGVFLMLINACNRTQGQMEVSRTDKDSLTESLNNKGIKDSSVYSKPVSKTVKDSTKKGQIETHKTGKVKIVTDIMGLVIVNDSNLNRDSL